MTLVAGVDSSTQSCKVVLCDAETGESVATAAAGHPEGTEVHPAAWAAALAEAGEGLVERAAAVAVAGQQHGMVTLDSGDDVVRPALLWNDTRSAAAAEELVAELGGRDAWARAVGSVPVASYTVTKLRWLARHEPDLARRVERVLLPHDWLTWQLAGRESEPFTDPGDASGTGYWSPSEGRYREDLLHLALGHDAALPRVAQARDVVGETRTGAALAAGTGDNRAAALGVGAGEHDVVVSIGTSGTAFAVSPTPTHDPTGAVSGFADATGRFLPLVCTLNAARVLTATAAMLGTDLAGLDELALSAPPGADGLVLLPYLDGERTPNLPTATGSLRGMTRANMTPGNVARAAVEGMLCALAAALDALTHEGVEAHRVILVGGGARSRAVQSLAPHLFDLPVVVPEPAEYVARGAARLAAWALAGTQDPPRWPVATGGVLSPDGSGVGIRARFHDEANQLLSAQSD
jgi:xylulokinase